MVPSSGRLKSEVLKYAWPFLGLRLICNDPALKQLFAKMGVRTRSQLVRIVLEQYKDRL